MPAVQSTKAAGEFPERSESPARPEWPSRNYRGPRNCWRELEFGFFRLEVAEGEKLGANLLWDILYLTRSGNSPKATA